MIRKAVFAFFLLHLILLPFSSEAAFKEQDVIEGNRLYQQEEFDASLKKYQEALKKDLESPIINYNVGTTYYKTQEYSKAFEHLQKALLSEDSSLQKDAHYNLGNALYQWGIAQEKDKIDVAIAALEKALSHYENTLKIDAQDEDAKINYEFVKKELERLKQQKQQQQQQSKQCPRPQKKDDSKQNENEENQQQQQQQDNQKQESSQGDSSQDAQSKEQKQGSENEQESGQQEQQQQQNQGQEESKQNATASSGKEQDASSEASQGQAAEIPQGEMSPQEAEMMLRSYQQNEEPQGMLQFLKQGAQDKPVLKDW